MLHFIFFLFLFYLIPYYSLLQLFVCILNKHLLWAHNFYIRLLLHLLFFFFVIGLHSSLSLFLSFARFIFLPLSLSLRITRSRRFLYRTKSSMIFFQQTPRKTCFYYYYYYIYIYIFFCNKLSERCLIRKTSRDSYHCLRVAYILT